MGKIIKNNAELSGLTKELKRGNAKIIMVNGCFDLFHAGHLSLLKFAKEQGGILIAAVNSDCSIKSLKGPSRPIIAQNDRLDILASIIYVDYAVIFNEEDPSELINIIRPDFIIKEEEYKNKAIGEISAIKKCAAELIFYKKENKCATCKMTIFVVAMFLENFLRLFDSLSQYAYPKTFSKNS